MQQQQQQQQQQEEEDSYEVYRIPERRRNEREEIRRRLAFGSSTDLTELQQTEQAEESSEVGSHGSLESRDVESASSSCDDVDNSLECTPVEITKKKFKDLVTATEILQNNAAIALLRARSHEGTPPPSRHAAAEDRKRSHSVFSTITGYADLIQSTNGHTHFTLARLKEFNVTRLQVVLNDMHSEINILNEELVDLLVQRDDLHMQQDARLVDIEDHTRRVNEINATT